MSVYEYRHTADPQEAANWTPLHEVHLRGRSEPTMLAVPK